MLAMSWVAVCGCVDLVLNLDDLVWVGLQVLCIFKILWGFSRQVLLGGSKFWETFGTLESLLPAHLSSGVKFCQTAGTKIPAHCSLTTFLTTSYRHSNGHSNEPPPSSSLYIRIYQGCLWRWVRLFLSCRVRVENRSHSFFGVWSKVTTIYKGLASYYFVSETCFILELGVNTRN